MCGGNEYGYDYGTFGDRESRHAFVRKVLSIVALQLVITVAIVIPFVISQPVKDFALKPENKWIPWLCIAITLAIMLIVGCVAVVRTKFPVNIILLWIFTIAEGVLIGFICSKKYPMHILIAFGTTVGLCIVLIIFAWQTRCDFTGFLPYIIIILLVLGIVAVVGIFVHNRILSICIAGAAVLLFSIYLIIDIQMMLGGRHKYQFDEDEYITAAMSIYIDIVTLFLCLLNLIGLSLDD